MVEPLPSKQITRVRFPSLAPFIESEGRDRIRFHSDLLIDAVKPTIEDGPPIVVVAIA